MWVEWVDPLKLDGAIGNASLDWVTMLNEGERHVCLIDSYGYQQAHNIQFFAMTYLSLLAYNVILNVVKNLSVCTMG